MRKNRVSTPSITIDIPNIIENEQPVAKVAAFFKECVSNINRYGECGYKFSSDGNSNTAKEMKDIAIQMIKVIQAMIDVYEKRHDRIIDEIEFEINDNQLAEVGSIVGKQLTLNAILNFIEERVLERKPVNNNSNNNNNNNNDDDEEEEEEEEEEDYDDEYY
jgi:hypothetical protein